MKDILFTFSFFLFISLNCWAKDISGSSYEVYEHIVLSQQITVSAHRLCQDGLFIYFKSEQDCRETPLPFQCDDLMVAPIRGVEKVCRDVAGESITRFFSVKTTFEYQQKSITEEGVEVTLLREKREMPECEGREIFEPANVGSYRYIDNDQELEVVDALLRVGHRFINTPYGQLSDIRPLRAKRQIEIDPNLPPFRSPHCNPSVTSPFLTILSGEHTGSGIESFQTDLMQRISRPVYLLNQSKLGAGQGLQFSCAQVEEI